MSSKHKKQFGIWMDTHHATVVGRNPADTGEFVILGHAKNNGAGSNSSENAANNLDKTLISKFFKEINTYMQNVEELHVTGTGNIQEQFINHLAETPQFKNVVANESTTNKMSDEKLVEYISAKFN